MAVDLAQLGIEVDSSDAEKASGDLDKLRKSADGAERSTEKLSRTSNLLSGSMKSLLRYAAGVSAAFFSVQTLVSAVGAAREFNAAMAETSTVIEGTAQEMAYIEERAVSMGKAFGTTATEQVRGFYEALSAGAGTVERASDIVEAANKLAIGGVTSTRTSVDVLTSVMNAYAQSGLTAAEVTDTLFQAIKAGKTTAEQLAGSLGQVIPIASSVGVEFDEVAAAIAALTAQGQSTSMAVTGVRGALAAVLKPSEQAKEVAKALGIEFDVQALRAKGLAGFLEDVAEKTGGSQEAMAQLFGGIEGLNAVLALTGGGAQAFADTLALMEEKAGATEEAFSKVAQSLDQRLRVQLALLGAALLAVGNALLAVLVPALEAVTSAVMVLADNWEILASIAVGLAASTIPALVSGLITLVTNLGLVSAAATALTSVMSGLGVAVTLAGGPLGIFLALLAGGAAYFLVFRDNAGEMEQAAYDAAAGTEALNSALGFFHQTAAPSAGKAAIDLANNNIILAKTAFDAAEAELAKTKAMNEAYRSALANNEGNRITDPNVPDYAEQARLEKEAEAAERLEKALRSLEQARADQRRAAAAVTGSTFSGDVTIPSDSLGVDIPSILDQLGIGGAGSVGEEMDSRLETLMDRLATERETLDAWRQEGIEILDEAYENERITKEQHDEAMLRLEDEYQRELAKIRQDGIAGALGQASDFFSELASLTQDRNSGLLRISRIFGAAQALINTYVAASQTLADPRLGFFAKFAAVAKVIAAGMGLVNAIKSGGSPSGHRSGGGRTVDTEDGRSTPAPLAPQRVLIEGIGPNTLLTGEMMQEIFTRFYDLNKDRSVVFQIGSVTG